MTSKRINIDVVGDTLKIDTTQSVTGKVIVDAKDQVKEIVQKNSEKDYSKSLEEKFKHDVEELRNNLFTLFSILASVIAFLFAEIQLLKNLCSRQGISGFTLILLGSLSLFLLLIKIFLSSKDKIKIDCPLIILGIFIIIILAVGVYLSSQGDEIKCRDDAIFEKYEEIFNEKQEEFSNKIEKNLKMNQEIFMSSYFQSSGLGKTVVQSTNLSGNGEPGRCDSAK